ncbi:OsmC family protein [Nocardia sp. NPDC006044]|uniref:OsmC family protein n=1 Tax=Nocardia sp. NPDC006044 TaxID=3364306 RepID=UPI0036B512FB
MSKEHGYQVTVRWTGNTGTGTSGYRDYGRDHDILADGKQPVKATADQAFLGTADRWNPEELLVATLSQCHMLTYLALCARAGVVVTDYTDSANGVMEEDLGGGGHFTEVVLRPEVVIADLDMRHQAMELHERAHKLCFIANSVNFPVRHEPVVR